MARYLVTSTVNANDTDGRTPVQYRKGEVVELTSAQVSALGASNFRLANNPLTTNGTQTGSPTHDLAGEAAGVSN